MRQADRFRRPRRRARFAAARSRTASASGRSSERAAGSSTLTMPARRPPAADGRRLRARDPAIHAAALSRQRASRRRSSRRDGAPAKCVATTDCERKPARPAATRAPTARRAQRIGRRQHGDARAATCVPPSFQKIASTEAAPKTADSEQEHAGNPRRAARAVARAAARRARTRARRSAATRRFRVADGGRHTPTA